MENNLVQRIDNWIRYIFYAIFFLVPLVMHPSTFELFEFNKVWTLYGLSLVILLLWISKITITKSFSVRRTPLDIPILAFLGVQILATIFSIDRYVSFWGYYSRFNGGLLSFITFIFLYYAFATNVIVKRKGVMNSIKVMMSAFISGIIVALWGFPSHFGADPTCLFFRGSLDVSCWTAAFQPKVRIFSTLGQPNWLAAYLSVLIPIGAALTFSSLKKVKSDRNKLSIITYIKKHITFLTLIYAALTALFYIDLIYTKSQSGFIGFWIGNLVFLSIVYLKLFRNEETESFVSVVKNKAMVVLLALNIVFLAMNFLEGIPISRLQQFTLQSVQSQNDQETSGAAAQPSQPVGPALEVGGSESGNIRLIVWTGALDIFKMYPLFGSGPETFAYSYYKVRPASHNLTSEWDYLYNKAHNEYLNYLSTTGFFGLSTYMLLIGWFFFTVFQTYRTKDLSSKQTLLSAALVGGFTSILVSNFFGFSVVIINIFLFIIPLWFYDITDHTVFPSLNRKHPEAKLNAGNLTLITMYAVIIFAFLMILLRYWVADTHYALGNNLNKVGEYVSANPELVQAVQMRPSEPVFKDELSINLATLALALNEQGQSTQAAQFGQQAKLLSDEVIQNHPHNVVFAKSRTRVLYSLAQIDPSYTDDSLEAIEYAHDLAPTDAKIMYNLALLYDQAGKREQAIKALEKTIELKPNYRDALYALALMYAEIAKTAESDGNITQAEEAKQTAREYLNTILNNYIPNDDQAKELLQSLE